VGGGEPGGAQGGPGTVPTLFRGGGPRKGETGFFFPPPKQKKKKQKKNQTGFFLPSPGGPGMGTGVFPPAPGGRQRLRAIFFFRAGFNVTAAVFLLFHTGGGLLHNTVDSGKCLLQTWGGGPRPPQLQGREPPPHASRPFAISGKGKVCGGRPVLAFFLFSFPPFLLWGAFLFFFFFFFSPF